MFTRGQMQEMREQHQIAADRCVLYVGRIEQLIAEISGLNEKLAAADKEIQRLTKQAEPPSDA